MVAPTIKTTITAVAIRKTRGLGIGNALPSRGFPEDGRSVPCRIMRCLRRSSLRATRSPRLICQHIRRRSPLTFRLLVSDRQAVVRPPRKKSLTTARGGRFPQLTPPAPSFRTFRRAGRRAARANGGAEGRRDAVFMQYLRGKNTTETAGGLQATRGASVFVTANNPALLAT